MRRTSVVGFALVVASCSSGGHRAAPPTSTTATSFAPPTTTTARAATTTTAPPKIEGVFELGSFSRFGPWSVDATKQRVRSDGRETDLGSTAYRSFDGGHWVALPPAPALPRFVDAQHGWALEYDGENDTLELWSTTDGGRHFASLGRPIDGIRHAGDNADVQFVDDTHGFLWASYLVAENWSLKRTSDGGRTWQPVSARGTAAPFGTPANFEFVSTREGYAVGMTATGKPPADSDLGYSADLYRTDDGGTTWRRYGPVVPGPHAAGLPTIKGGALDLPVVRYQGGIKTLELWAGSRSSDTQWHRTASVVMTGPDLVSGAAMNQPVAGFLDANDAVAVDGARVLAISAGRPPMRTALAGPFVASLTVANGLVYADTYRGLSVSADGGFTWKSVKLPSR